MKKRILFVDDEPNILDGLRNSLRRQRGEWDMVFTLGGPAALEALGKESYDVVVTDMRMAGMDGAHLLRQVKERHPAVARLVLSGHADQDAVASVLPLAHQYLSKPCKVDDLRITIDRVCGLQTLLHDDAIRKVIGSLDRLPSVPQNYWDLTRAAADPNSGMDDIAKIVQRDPAMTLKILQLVNSAYFGLAQKVSTIDRAVAYLGTEVLKSLALGANVFSNTTVPEIEGFSLERLQATAVLRAKLARRFMTGRKGGDEAFTAALIHDIGSLVLATALPQLFGEVIRESDASGRPMYVVEKERFGITHAEIGAYLQGIWGLPFSIVQAAAYHHSPSEAPSGDLEVLAALHVADALIDDRDGGVGAEDAALDVAFLDRAGCGDKLPQWRALAAEEMGRLN